MLQFMIMWKVGQLVNTNEWIRCVEVTYLCMFVES